MSKGRKNLRTGGKEQEGKNYRELQRMKKENKTSRKEDKTDAVSMVIILIQ